MKGLLYKDLVLIKEYYLKIMLLLFLLYAVIFMVINGGESMIYMMAGVFAVVFAVTPITTFSVDNTSKWDCFALSAPLRRRDLVGGKYLLSIIVTVIGTGVSGFLILIALLTNKLDGVTMGEMAGLLYGSFAISFLFVSGLLPLTYRFGPEKSRPLVIVAVLIPTVLSALIEKLGISPPTPEQIKLLLALSPLMLIAILIGSYLLSLHIYEKQDIV